MKKKVDKRELKFEEYNSMSEEQFQDYKRVNNEKLEEIEAKISKIESYIDDIKSEKVKEERSQELAELKEEKNKILKEKKYIVGYTNNKTDILLVKKHEAKIDLEIEKLKNEREITNNEIKELEAQKAELEKAEEIKEEESKIEKAEKGINAWLENPEELTNEELYVEVPEMKRKLEERKQKLAEKKVELQKSIKSIDNKIKWRNTKINTLDKKILALEQSKSKCKFIYRNLMDNKSWDEISYDAVRRFDKKLNKEKTSEEKEQVINKEEKQQEETIDNKEGIEEIIVSANRAEIETGTNQIISSQNEIKSVEEVEEIEIIEQETTAITKYDKFKAKHPRIGKIIDWFKKIGNKIYDFLDNDSMDYEEVIEEELEVINKEPQEQEIIMQKEVVTQEQVQEEIIEAIQQEMKEEMKKEVEKEIEKPVKVRDSFIDALHVNIDEAKAKKEAKEKAQENLAKVKANQNEKGC